MLCYDNLGKMRLDEAYIQFISVGQFWICAEGFMMILQDLAEMFEF